MDVMQIWMTLVWVRRDVGDAGWTKRGGDAGWMRQGDEAGEV